MLTEAYAFADCWFLMGFISAIDILLGRACEDRRALREFKLHMIDFPSQLALQVSFVGPFSVLEDRLI